MTNETLSLMSSKMEKKREQRLKSQKRKPEPEFQGLHNHYQGLCNNKNTRERSRHGISIMTEKFPPKGYQTLNPRFRNLRKHQAR